VRISASIWPAPGKRRPLRGRLACFLNRNRLMFRFPAYLPQKPERADLVPTTWHRTCHFAGAGRRRGSTTQLPQDQNSTLQCRRLVASIAKRPSRLISWPRRSARPSCEPDLVQHAIVRACIWLADRQDASDLRGLLSLDFWACVTWSNLYEPCLWNGRFSCAVGKAQLAQGKNG
jgi:hypothetical protein